MTCPDIFQYLDYRLYLRDACTARKDADTSFTFRTIADRVGIDSGYVAKIFQRERHISPKLVEPFVELLGIDVREADHFRHMFAFGKGKTHAEKDAHFVAMISGNKSGRSVLAADQYELFSHWYNLAIREILSFYRFTGDHAELAKLVSPAITASQARAAIRLLEKQKLISKRKDGSYEKISPIWTTGEDTRSLAVVKYQKSMLDLTRDAYDRLPPEDRHMSTLTLSCSEAEYKEIVSDIQKLRKKLLDMAEKTSSPDRVIHCGFSVFPVSSLPRNEVAE